MGRRARRVAIGSIAALIIVAWGGWRSRSVRLDRAAMAEARADARAGRSATAARRLVALLAERPDWDEAAYLLGTCERADGRGPAADRAWARIPPGSPFGARAVQRRMELLIDRGRFAEAEELVGRATQDPGYDASALPLYLGPVYWLQGRLDDAAESVEARWDVLDGRGEGASEKAIELVRLHIELRRGPMPVEVVRDGLEKAGAMAPDDDRVWLGKANLALREGSYDQAGGWIERCLARRPEDPPAWRARLDWAVATGRVAEALEAARHLPIVAADPARADRLSAWLAGRRADRAAERRALERLVEADPGDSSALDRLAELSRAQGPATVSHDLTRRKAEIAAMLARYEKLHARNQPQRDAEELARLAGRLGRRFEARGFATLALALEPGRDETRRELVVLLRRDPSPVRSGRMLADALTHESLTRP